MNLRFQFLFWIFSLTAAWAYAQCAENIGFEKGNLNKWSAYEGNVLPDGTIDVAPTFPTAGRHTIMTEADGKDLYGEFPVVSPNGSKYSVRLGNNLVGHQAERLSYEFTVPNISQYSLVLNYAVVLQNPNDHAAYEQPRFTVNVYNVTDNQKVSCPAFDFMAASELPGFKISNVVVDQRAPASVYYKDWASTTIDLNAYLGKTIR